VNGLDRFAIANRSDAADVTTDVLVGMAMIFPPLLDYGDVGASREWLEDTLVFAQALAINGALVTAVKYLVQRPLPRTYDGRDASLVETASGYRSFYSGHVSTTMAALTAASMTLTLRHHVGAWPWLVSAGVGATVAVGRVAAGRHFPTDVLVGAAAGTAVGTLVSWLHARPQSFAIALPTPNGASVLIGTCF
jgi:membrane-associated phospholipid phosphatase